MNMPRQICNHDEAEEPDAWERDDDESCRPPEFGCCLPPGECCMPGLHFPSECHTAADYVRAHHTIRRANDELSGGGK